eukprot:jgi/Bigna1/68168/fgenesh1_pg.5_\
MNSQHSRTMNADVNVYDVPIGNGRSLHTAEGGRNHSTVLVCTAGYGAGLGFFFRNYKSLTSKYHVYAVDLLGWGLSSRPPWPRNHTSVEDAERFFTESLEKWRQAIGLKKPFVLMGHSFGGYLCSAYALRFRENLKKLILAGPAGFNPRPTKFFASIPEWSSFAGYVAKYLWRGGLTPGSLIRGAGPQNAHTTAITHNTEASNYHKDAVDVGRVDERARKHNLHILLALIQACLRVRLTFSRPTLIISPPFLVMSLNEAVAVCRSAEHSLKHLMSYGAVALKPLSERLTVGCYPD